MPARDQTPLPHELLLDAPLSSSLLSSARRLVVEQVRAWDDMAAAKQQPPLYIAVADDRQRSSFRCTRPVMQSALQLMGCKSRHAFKGAMMNFTEDVPVNKGSVLLTRIHGQTFNWF
ncbi:hypothetical protein ACQJBY_033170 [Aegilops geniculata]